MRLFAGHGQERVHQRRARGATAPGEAHIEGLTEVGNGPRFNNVAFQGPGPVGHVRLDRHPKAGSHQAAHCFGGSGAQGHAWLQRGCSPQALGVVAHFVDVQLNQWLARHIGQVDAVVLQQRVLRRQPQAMGRVGEDFGLQGVAVFEVGQDQHSHIDLTADQQMLDVRAFILHHADFHIRIGALETGQQVGKVIPGNQAGHADDQLAGNLVGALLQAALGVVDGGKNQVRLAQELMALVGQGHALGVAVEQVDADFLLQLLDGQGQGRLGNERGLRGGGDRARLGHGDEMPDLTQGHHAGITSGVFL